MARARAFPSFFFRCRLAGFDSPGGVVATSYQSLALETVPPGLASSRVTEMRLCPVGGIASEPLQTA